MTMSSFRLLGNTLAAILTMLVIAVAFLSWCYADTIWRMNVAEKVVALTYDDGPNPPYTGQLLTLLKSEGVVATFFLKGRNVEAFPDIPRVIGEDGHEIGNHSYQHKAMWSFSKQVMLQEVSRVDALLDGYPGYHPKMFRPPYGAQGAGLKRALQELGKKSIVFDVVGVDWELAEARAIADRVLSGVTPGSIVLLHDGHADIDEPHEQDSRAATIEATGIIVRELKSRGYRFVVVSELLALGNS